MTLSGPAHAAQTILRKSESRKDARAILKFYKLIFGGLKSENLQYLNKSTDRNQSNGKVKHSSSQGSGRKCGGRDHSYDEALGHSLDGLHITSLDNHLHLPSCQFETEQRQTEDTKHGMEAIVCVAWIQGGDHGGGHRGVSHHGGVYPGGRLDGHGGQEKGIPEQHADWRQASCETCFNHPTALTMLTEMPIDGRKPLQPRTKDCFILFKPCHAIL